MRISLAALATGLLASPALAQDRDAIIVTGRSDDLKLDTATGTASRLGLTIQETPATVEVLTQADLQLRGLRTARETFADVPGAIAGNVPGNPAVVSMRGFAGNVVSILQDGVRISSSTVVQRDTNSWHFDAIEIIKGPASVLFGEGALGGVINKITRKPRLGDTAFDGLASYGSFDTLTVAAGANVPLSNTLALRADASHMESASLYDVDDNRTYADGLTASLLFQPSADLSVLLAVDNYADRYDSSYQGTVLIPAAYARQASDAVRSDAGLVVDRALRRQSYTPAGGYSGADETTVRSRMDWRVGAGWALAADLTYYTSDRAFLTNGTRDFATPSIAFPDGSIVRGLTRFYHDHQFSNGRLAAGNDRVIAGMRNRFTLGVEYNHTDFSSLRETSTNALVPPVDLFDPVVGTFPAEGALYRSSNVNFVSGLETISVFAEDALNLTPDWLLVVGARYDHMDLERSVTDLLAANRFTTANPVYRPFSWRVGTSYEVAPDVTLYGQYTTAVTPVSSILLQSIANASFRLTTGYSYEAGFKAALFGRHLTVTGAAYRIVQDDILTRDPADPQLTVQGGTQSSQGLELSLAAQPTSRLSLGASLGYADANYDALVEAGGADRTGNRPINVPSTTGAANASWRLPWFPVTVSGFVRHASGFYTDTANTIFVRGRTTFDAAVSWQALPQLAVALRGRNLTDAFYGEYSGYNSTDVYIGAPRSVEVSLSVRM